MQSHLGRASVDTNASRSRAISEPTGNDTTPAHDQPGQHQLQQQDSLRPRSTSSYSSAPHVAEFREGPLPTGYPLESSSVAHLSPGARSIFIAARHDEQQQQQQQQQQPQQPQQPTAAYSPAHGDPYGQSAASATASFGTPTGQPWVLYQSDGSAGAERSPSQVPIRQQQRVQVPPQPAPPQDDRQPRPNMSAFDYIFPPGVAHFSQAPHYDAVLQSTFQDYNSIPVPDVPQLDPALRLTTDQDGSRYYGRPISTSPSTSLPSPHPSPQDREIMRQRRQYHQTRRLAKTRARTQRSPSSPYFPNQAGGRDVGLGIDMSPEPVMTPTSAQFSPGMPTLLENYTGERTSTPTRTTYADHYQSAQPEHGSFDMPLGMTMPTSHPVYQPSPLPSMSGLVDAGAPRQYPHSSHGTPASSPGASDQVRILGSRPKPQCWDHGCNGRQFSTFSNLLRHQREKSGTSTKSYCPRCGAEFTRTTARNGHMAHEKCKSRRSS